MLPEAQRDVLMAHYRNKPLSTSLFSINLGLSQPPSTLGVSAYSTMIIPDWMRRFSDFKRCATLLKNMPGDQLPMLAVVDYSHIESGLGNDDLFPLSVVGVDRLTNWEGLSNDAYNAKKDAWLTVIVNRLDKEWPGLSGAVVQQEMATARTMFEYLNTPGGALYGFAPNVPNRLLLSGPPRSSKTSIKGLWLASAFAGFGGFSGAMGAGGAAAKAALHDTYPKIQPQWRLFVLIRK
jgi:phytoene dehydrogenase-like protein